MAEDSRNLRFNVGDGLMADNGSIEKRLAALEQEVSELRRHIKDKGGEWPDRLFGRMREIPEEEFKEFVRLGKEFRDAQSDPAC